jgi:probable phosphoglycerate mutase
VSIYLIRHGETPGNAGRIVQVASTPLSKRGVAQASRLAARLRDAGIARIVSSDLTRARQTAESLSDAAGLSVEFDSALQERNFGDLRGTAYADLEVDLFGPDFAPPGGETWDAFHDRVDGAWASVARLAEEAADAGHLAVVTHGLVCHSLVSRRLELSDRPLPDVLGEAPRFGNTALTIIEPEPPWRVELLACTAHLDGGDLADDDEAISGI